MFVLSELIPPTSECTMSSGPHAIISLRLNGNFFILPIMQGSQNSGVLVSILMSLI